MRLLVFGASGRTGQEVVRQAAARGFQVTAFVRNPDKLRNAPATVSTRLGNVADADAVAASVKGHDAVVSALGVGTPLKHDADVIAGIQHIVRAMEAHGVRRLIYVSFIGVRASRHAVGFILRYVAPIPLRHEISDHEAKENLVRGSELDWTIVRPPKLTMGPRTGTYRTGESIRTSAPVPVLSRADLADFILQELEQPRFVRGAPRLLS
jgi:putative NADH-flavin reductase